MSYNNSIPNISDFVLQSGPQLRANYNSIFTSFSQDHYPMNNPNAGMHKSLTLRPQNADPVTGADEVAIYNKIGTGTVPQLFYAPNNAQTPIQLTFQSVVNTGDRQYSYVAGPFIFYFGKINAPLNNQVVTLSPSSTLITVILVGGSNKGSDITLQNLAYSFSGTPSGSSFTMHIDPLDGSSIPTLFVSYTAIGLVT